MRKPNIRVSAGAAILLAALYLLLDFETIGAVALCVAVHEAGHLAALRALGSRVRGIRLGLTGLCITYTGRTGYGGQFAAAFAGPVFGAVFALISARLGTEYENSFLCLCAGISAILSVFNLLPVQPLDGGRMLSAVLCARWEITRAERAARAAGTAAGLVLMSAGLVLIWIGKGAAMEIAAVWLMLSQPNDVHSLVKMPGVL